MNTSSFIKLILSILLLLCFLHMPYSYYQAVRFMAMFGFAVLAYYNYQQNKTTNAAVIIYVALAVLFQPFAKIALGRTVWNVVDTIVAVGLIISLFGKKGK